MTKTLNLNKPTSPLQVLFRPILFAAVAFHALLFFAPLPTEQKPKEPDDKKNPIKITQVPTATPAKAKSAPTVKVKATPARGRPVVPAQPVLAATNSTSTPPAFTPANPLPSQSSFTLPRVSQPLPPSSSDPTSALLAASRASVTDPAKALYELLAEMPEPDQFDAAAGSATRLDLIEDPAIFFKPAGEPDVVPEPVTGLASSPLFAPGEEPAIFFETYFSQPLQGIFEKINKVGEYGGGPLYKLEKGSYTAFLSLVPPKQGTVGAIVSVWSKDPRSK